MIAAPTKRPNIVFISESSIGEWSHFPRIYVAGGEVLDIALHLDGDRFYRFDLRLPGRLLLHELCVFRRSRRSSIGLRFGDILFSSDSAPTQHTDRLRGQQNRGSLLI